jgi:hypothetical protein
VFSEHPGFGGSQISKFFTDMEFAELERSAEKVRSGSVFLIQSYVKLY